MPFEKFTFNCKYNEKGFLNPFGFTHKEIKTMRVNNISITLKIFFYFPTMLWIVRIFSHESTLELALSVS